MKISNRANLRMGSAPCDCDAINARLDNREANAFNQCCDCESIESRLTALEEHVFEIEKFVTISEVTDYMAPTSVTTPIRGIGVSAIRIGNTYNIWGTGALPGPGSISLNGGTTYYLLLAGTPTDPNAPILDKMYELTWYVGDPTIGTLWIKDEGHAGGSAYYSLPLQFDSTGIYFSIPSGNINNLTPGTTFKFTQALILVPPSTP